MPVLADLLQRWGFVKLRSYGLDLTGDGRIVSTRSTVLNDGTGAKIVGWRDGDVSIWKLNEWDKAPVVPALPAPPPGQPSASVIPTEVAAEPVVEEDDW